MLASAKGIGPRIAVTLSALLLIAGIPPRAALADDTTSATMDASPAVESGYPYTDTVAPAAPPKQFSVYGFIENFTWEEEIEGQRLLKEEGPRFGVGGQLSVPASGAFWLSGRGELYAGEVDYDGALQDGYGNLTPYSSKTSYVGIRGNILATTPIQGSDPSIVLWPQLGLGMESWVRSLDTEFGDEVGPYGYQEMWSSIRAVLGARLTLTQASGLQLFGTFQLRLPLWNKEVVDLSENGGPDDIELEPDEQISFYADAGLNTGRLTLAIFGETLEYDQSPVDDSGTFLQPDSSAEIIGGKVGVVF
jgi:hypothetical protein